MGEANGSYTGINEIEDSDTRVHEWETGLPNVGDLTPLTQHLIPPEMLTAFNIKPEPYRTSTDVARASHLTISSIRGDVIADEDVDDVIDGGDDESEMKKQRRNASPEDADSAAKTAAAKRARLVWTPQLHKRFVDVVAHLGIKNAVPKTIMQLMNVEGLTRENVASHLQKYRLYLKRMGGGGGGSFDGPGNSNSEDNRTAPAPSTHPMVPVPIPMMGMGMGMGNFHGQQQQQQPHYGHNYNHGHYQQYGNGMMQSGNKYGSIMPYQYHHPPHVAPGDK